MGLHTILNICPVKDSEFARTSKRLEKVFPNYMFNKVQEYKRLKFNHQRKQII